MSQNDEVKMSRRRLLKLIAATGGAVAASGLVPAQWITPMVNVGTLPALAQVASPWVELELRYVETEEPVCDDSTDVYADYYDPTGGITADTVACQLVHMTCVVDDTTVSKSTEQCITLGELGDDWSGGAKEGSIYVGCACLGKECDIPPECTVTIVAWLEGSNVVELPCQLFGDASCRDGGDGVKFQGMIQGSVQSLLAE
jgi:hypothetical protein